MIALPAVFLAACGTVGDTADVKKANELAIACETDKALKAVDQSAAGGGLSAHIADQQWVVSFAMRVVCPRLRVPWPNATSVWAQTHRRLYDVGVAWQRQGLPFGFAFNTICIL